MPPLAAHHIKKQIKQVPPAQVRYKYNSLSQLDKVGSKELQDELGLAWYDYGARNYDAAVGQWMSIDPLAEKYPGMSPYHYTFDNPVRYVDPDGKEGEENDWVPVIRLNKLSKQTEVKYMPENGDNAETLQQQYGLTKEQAHELYYNHRDWDGSISGEAVEAVTGNEVLKLKGFRDNQKNLNHIMFAMLYSKINNTRVGGDEEDVVMIVSNFFNLENKTIAHSIEGEGIFNVNGVDVNISVELFAINTFRGWRSDEYNTTYAYSVFINNSFDNRSESVKKAFSTTNLYFAQYQYFPGNSNVLRPWYYRFFTIPKSQADIFLNYYSNINPK